MGDRHALRLSCRTRGEDHPAVVVEAGTAGDARTAATTADGESATDDGGDRRFVPGLLGARLGVGDVDWDVGRAGAQHAEDGEIEVTVAVGDAYADPVAAPDAKFFEAGGKSAALLVELAVGEVPSPVVERNPLAMGHDGGSEDLLEGAWKRSRCPLEQGQAVVLALRVEVTASEKGAVFGQSKCHKGIITASSAQRREVRQGFGKGSVKNS
jgi:hypothetical protein